MKKGYLQVYTGDGKGKTTAALGLALRAVGRGLRVVVFQFLKGSPSGELNSAARFGEQFKIVRLAETGRFAGSMGEEEKQKLRRHLREELALVRAVMEEKSCDILILDEIMAAVHSGLVEVEELCDLLDSRPPDLEMVLTGRCAPGAVIDRADLVTEMVPVRHYLDRGVRAREGIEM